MDAQACKSISLALMAAGLLSACGGGGGGDAAGPAQPTLGELPARRASAASPVAATCTGGNTTGTLYRGAEVEPFAAVAPNNANRLLAAWQQDRFSDGGALAIVSAVSDDGGATWQRTLQPMSRCGGAATSSAGDFARSSDPWVDFAPDGTAHLLGLSFSGAALTAGSSSAMLASRSIDGGRTWSAPATLQRDAEGLFNDKGALTADATDARFVYAVWDRVDSAGRGPAMLARSVTGGASWEAARVFYTPSSAGTSQTIGNRIVVLAGGAERGTLVNVFAQIDTVGSASTVRMGGLRSTDQGQTWGAPVFISDARAVGTRDPATGHAVRDGSGLPTVAAGPDGSLWVAWQDARFSNGARDAIALSKSTDGGRTWSAPVAINRVASTAAFTPALHVRADGVVGVLHYDLRNDTADAAQLLSDAWLLTSRDGVNWTETHVAGPFDLAAAPDASGYFLGDYQGLTSSGAAFVPLLVLSQADAANRSDVYAPRFDVAATAQASHQARAAAAGSAMSAAFRAAQQSATAAALDRRLPGWSARAQATEAAGRTP